MRQVKTFGIVGTGVIGAGWAARCLANGLKVVAWDPSPRGEEQLYEKVRNAWPSLEKLGLHPDASLENMRYVSSLEELCAEADFIQENAPERLELKIDLHAQLDELAPRDVIIASSTSGLLPSDFQSACRQRPERHIVGHPFNPVYLLPLVEICPGKLSDEEVLAAATAFYESIGMYALRLRKEVEGFLSDRLQEAMWRENLHLINDGVATTQEMDDAMIYGPGLRFAFMGGNKTYALAGGENGMRHFMNQFGPALKLPWTKLEAPELTDGLIDKLVEGTDEQLSGTTISEMERLRDDCLIAIMQALSTYRVGAGAVLARNAKG